MNGPENYEREPTITTLSHKSGFNYVAYKILMQFVTLDLFSSHLRNNAAILSE